MAETVNVSPSVQPTTSTSQDSVHWPLSFQLKPPPPVKHLNETHSGRPDHPERPGHPERPVQYWSHALYRGPGNKPPQVFYSTTKEASELLAQKFLQEPVVGFDGEWCSWYPKPGHSLKSIFSLVQVACEDKIGLFHIARHEGETPEDLIAPSLRKIIESPDIIKTGVKIHGADLIRLQQHFGLNPQGGFELSDLHRLVTYTSNNYLVALAKQVQFHLGLPLAKGPVRTSNWMRPLSAEQKFYAADDAYAGFMLYHCMSAKRVAMDLTLPLSHLPRGIIPKQEPPPKPPEKLQTPQKKAVQNPALKHAPYCVRLAWSIAMGEPRPLQEPEKFHTPQRFHTPQKEAVQVPELSGADRELFLLLKSHRAKVAFAEGVPRYFVAPDKALIAIAQAHPKYDADLIKIPGIGPHRTSKYGIYWLHIISEFDAKHPAQPVPQQHGIFSEKTPSDLNIMGQQPHQSPNRGHKRTASASEQEACVAPPLAHTGLSFHMDEASLRANEPPQTGKKDSDTSAFSSSLPSPKSPEGGHKRRRCDSTPPHKDVARGTADCDQHQEKQPQASVNEIDYFLEDEDEETLWAEAFDNLNSTQAAVPC